MHIKLLLAAAAVLASVGVAQAQERGAAEILFPSQDRATDSTPDGENTVSYGVTQDVRSEVPSAAQASVTSKVSRVAPVIVFPSQDRDTDSTPD